MMKPADFIRDYIKTHEGGLSLDPVDHGNWHNGVLVGSNFGVTGDVLAKARQVNKVTPADMAALTLDEAVSIGCRLFYAMPHFDLLPWDPAVASVLDMGWGAGPGQAIKLLQRMIGANDDGQLGPYTARLYRSYVADHGIEATARAYGDVRIAFYSRIIAIHPSNEKYRKGWRNRAISFLPGTPWWRRFVA
ncbi:MAG: glycosyl hydrolase 108 family protein [Sphingomonas sp.]